MKFLLALAFLAVVCAIPHPGYSPVNNQELVQRVGPIQGTEQGKNQVHAKSPSSLQPKNFDESDEVNYDDDEDDSEKMNNLGNLISTLNSIREKLKNKIHDKLGHNNNTTEAPQERNNTDKEGPTLEHRDCLQNASAVSNHNYTKGNDTASDHKSKINITQIKQEIRDNIEGFILNILRPWLSNNSVEDGAQENANGTTTGINQSSNATEPQRNTTALVGVNGNSTEAPKPENETVSVSPQPGNYTVTVVPLSENDTVDETPYPENDTVTVAPQSENDTVTEDEDEEISIISEVSQGVQERQ